MRALGWSWGVALLVSCGGTGEASSGSDPSPSTTTTPASSTATLGTSTDGTVGTGSAGTSGSVASSTAGAPTTSSSSGAMGSDDSGSQSTGETRLPPYPDLSLGPYPSLLTMAIDSMLAGAEGLDTGATYSHSAAQGYLLQAIGELLWDARDHELLQREALIEAALTEIGELEAASGEVLGGGPGFGLDEAWDAFGDGSVNPPYTAYTWQSGMVALGVAKMVRVLEHEGHPDVAGVREFGEALVSRWDAHYTTVADGGWWWYSTAPADAIAVHNTSALIAMASQILAEHGSAASFGERPPASADLLWARMSGNPTDGYVWNYADDGYPSAPRAEDVSHALVTLQLMREAGERGWWGASQMQGVGVTLSQTMWSGHPARLNGFVDGTPGDERAWGWSRAAIIGYAAHGDAPGGDPAVFEQGRSLLFSSYLSRFERPLEGATVDSARSLALALLLTHRPAALASGTTWQMEAGPGDDAVPAAAGGVRFYSVDWSAPADLDRGLVLPSRTSSTANANVVIDLEDGVGARVLVSLVYASATGGALEQYDGEAYTTLGSLPATVDEEGTVRWMRTTVELDAQRFDYQAGVPGTNVLLQLTHPNVSISRIEASPL